LKKEVDHWKLRYYTLIQQRSRDGRLPQEDPRWSEGLDFPKKRGPQNGVVGHFTLPETGLPVFSNNGYTSPESFNQSMSVKSLPPVSHRFPERPKSFSYGDVPSGYHEIQSSGYQHMNSDMTPQVYTMSSVKMHDVRPPVKSLQENTLVPDQVHFTSEANRSNSVPAVMPLVRSSSDLPVYPTYQQSQHRQMRGSDSAPLFDKLRRFSPYEDSSGSEIADTNQNAGSVSFDSRQFSLLVDAKPVAAYHTMYDEPQSQRQCGLSKMPSIGSSGPSDRQPLSEMYDVPDYQNSIDYQNRYSIHGFSNVNWSSQQISVLGTNQMPINM
jgi:hypothetical protein